MQSEEGAGCNTKSIEGVCLCPLEGIIHTISRKWTLQIVTMIGNHGSLRYSEIQTMCSGISPTVLSSRLRELEDESIISREAFAEIPPRVEYSLTEDGVGLRTLITPLMTWASNRSS
ncbi:MAG: winged helix-turn-helix transcriptional regulator [Candidatus Thorarchaeota archaeon]